ncbi:lamina-associated polypeptide 2, isoforms alpha/zeta-like [Erythrolamprus reginae]|uniref:lamina-associated polypeptide 2, isoforms alpha/zeta-like n=1 Tax=Erythrolamprus reginae TaxID=121349 RepID=UPI00396CF27F
MADQSSTRGEEQPHPTSVSAKNKEKVSGKTKAKSSQSSASIKEAERKIKALEQRLEVALASPASGILAIPPFQPLPPSRTASPGLPLGVMGSASERDWSPDRQALPGPPPPSPLARPDRPASASHHVYGVSAGAQACAPIATFTPTAAGLRSQTDVWQAFPPYLQDMIANVYAQGMAVGAQHVTPPIPQSYHPRDLWSAPPPPPGLDSLAGDTGLLEEDSDHGNNELSDEEYAFPELPAPAGLFKPALYRLLLHKVKQTLDVPGAVAPPDTGDGLRTSASLCKEQPRESDTVPAMEIFLENIKRTWQHPAAAQGPSNIERRFYTFDNELESLLQFLPVDKPVATLVSNAAFPSETADSLKPDERRAETLLKKANQMAAWALQAASTASIFNRASIMWIQEVQARMGPEDPRLKQDLNKLLAAAEFSADATLHAAKFAARGMASTISSRRLLWLRHWQADAKSKWRLSSAPFEGTKLFGEVLEAVLVEDKDKRKVLTRSSRRQDRNSTPYRRRQPFRWDAASGNTQASRPYSQGQYGQSYSYRNDRTYFQGRGRGYQQSKRPFRGSNQRGFRGAK